MPHRCSSDTLGLLFLVFGGIVGGLRGSSRFVAATGRHVDAQCRTFTSSIGVLIDCKPPPASSQPQVTASHQAEVQGASAKSQSRRVRQAVILDRVMTWV